MDLRTVILIQLCWVEVKMKKLLEKILVVFAKNQTVSLATIAPDGKPWVRFVTLFAKADFPLLFCTDIGSRKIAHIKKNPEVHITCGNLAPPDDSVYLQIQAKAAIITNPKTRKSYWNADYIRYFKGPDDPNFVIVQVQPYRIEYYGPDSFVPEIWELSN